MLIFPEGELTVHGPMQPFKSGTGLIAVEAGVPVLPVRIDVLSEGSADRGRWLPPRRGTRAHRVRRAAATAAGDAVCRGDGAAGAGRARGVMA